jgi:CBS domain-containing protein
MVSKGAKAMLVREAMTRNVQTIPENSTVFEAARFMETFGVGALPATDGHTHRITGFLTDRDIVTKGVAAGGDPKAIQVKDVMTKKPIAIFENQSLSDAAEAMKGHRVRRLIVLDLEGETCGIISLDDLSRGDLPPAEIEEVLRKVSASNGSAV